MLHIYFLNRPKHPVKLHVWAGISCRGPTAICTFEGILRTDGYIAILERSLLPFLRAVYPDGHKFVQDNDPKHTAARTRQWLEDNAVNWWRTPAESPDMNPIECLWHELKEYIRREVKPRTKRELDDGIHDFWATVTVAKCQKYIGHLQKVLPAVIQLKGAATGH